MRSPFSCSTILTTFMAAPTPVCTCRTWKTQPPVPAPRYFSTRQLAEGDTDLGEVSKGLCRGDPPDLRRREASVPSWMVSEEMRGVMCVSVDEPGNPDADPDVPWAISWRSAEPDKGERWLSIQTPPWVVHSKSMA